MKNNVQLIPAITPRKVFRLLPHLVAGLCAFTLLWFSTGCSKNPADARTRLAALRMEFTPTDFLHAAQQGDKTAVDLFLAAGMNPNTVQAGMSALLVAAGRGSKEVVEMLVKAGADANFTSQVMQGETPLLLALLSGDPKGHQRAKDAGRATTPIDPKDLLAIVKLLVKHGAKTDVRDSFGNTPLMVAMSIGSPELVECLVESGASPAFSGTDGTTPLIQAIISGNVRAVKLLLGKGADDTHSDDKGHRPIDYAKQSGNAEVVNLLEEHASREAAKLQKGADAGDLKATVALGVRYIHGAGVKPDSKKALALFSQAAAKGDPWGLCLAGQCYLAGEESETNRHTGLDLLFQAADKGNEQAVARLTEEYKKMKDLQQDLRSKLPLTLQNALTNFIPYYESCQNYLAGYWGPGFYGEREQDWVRSLAASAIHDHLFHAYQGDYGEKNKKPVELERMAELLDKQLREAKGKEPKPTRIEALMEKLPAASSRDK